MHEPMTVEEIVFHDAILDGLQATEAYETEHQMTSSLLAICHAQQIQIRQLRGQRDAARADLARYTAAQVLDA